MKVGEYILTDGEEWICPVAFESRTKAFEHLEREGASGHLDEGEYFVARIETRLVSTFCHVITERPE